jgi:Flp pilus assembly protein TadG
MFKRFLGDRRANVATIFAIAAIPLLSVTGAVVDYTYGFRLRTLAQDALDAATLAGGKKVTSGQTVVSAEVSSFFASNVSGVISPVPTVTAVVSGATVTSTATLNVPTHILSVVGIDNLEFDLRSQVTSGIGTLEVALALDNSGSMAGSKISTLKTAANDLVTTLYGLASTSTKPDPIKVGVVPFASSVNVGSSYSSASWMDTTAVGTYHADAMEAAYKAVKGTSTTVNNFSLFTQMNTTWGGCVEARPIPYDATDDTPTTSTPGTMFVPMLAADEPDDWTSSSSCSSTQKIGSNSSLRYNCALSGSQSYNNYLPDVGTPKACGNTVTMTLANPAVFTAPSAHGLAVGDMVVFNTTGTLPSTITSGTTYYVKTVPSSTTFTISSSSGG